MSTEEQEKENQSLGILPETLFAERGGWPTGVSTPSYNPATNAPPDIAYQTQFSQKRDPLDIDVTLESQGGNIPGLGDINSFTNPQLFKALRRQGRFLSLPFTAGTSAINLRPEELRTYFFIQNLHATEKIYVGFGTLPTASTGLPLNAGDAYEPFTVPNNSIYVLGSAGSVAGLLLYSVEPR